MACSNNMKQIVLALQNYHDVYKSFPAAYIPDENGKPKHSWRVLILPFLERWDLYDAYNFDEPWNGPHNRSLLHRTPPALRCPSTTSSEADTTEYFAVVGPSAAWPGRGKEVVRFPRRAVDDHHGYGSRRQTCPVDRTD